MRKCIFNFRLWQKVIKSPRLSRTSSLAALAFLSTLCTFTSRGRGLTGRRCRWNPCLNSKVANQLDSYCRFHLKSNRSRPLLLTVQRADSITRVTLIRVKRENGSLLLSTPVLHSFLPLLSSATIFSISASTSLAVSCTRSFSPPNPFSLSNLRLYFCHVLLLCALLLCASLSTHA